MGGWAAFISYALLKSSVARTFPGGQITHEQKIEEIEEREEDHGKRKKELRKKRRRSHI